jgi:hypothetical protein
MADIYTLDEFDAYLQATANETTATLLRELVTGLIEDIDGRDYSELATTATYTTKSIALEAAARAYRNPEGLTSYTIDDYTARRDTQNAAPPGLYLTDAEISQLRPVVPRNRSVVLTLPS